MPDVEDMTDHELQKSFVFAALTDLAWKDDVGQCRLAMTAENFQFFLRVAYQAGLDRAFEP